MSVNLWIWTRSFWNSWSRSQSLRYWRKYKLHKNKQNHRRRCKEIISILQRIIDFWKLLRDAKAAISIRWLQSVQPGQSGLRFQGNLQEPLKTMTPTTFCQTLPLIRWPMFTWWGWYLTLKPMRRCLVTWLEMRMLNSKNSLYWGLWKKCSLNKLP